MSNKISVQQRKYFTERINEAINDRISVLKHKNASQVTEMGNKQFNSYLKEIGVYDNMLRYAKIRKEADDLNATIRQVYDNIKRALDIKGYHHDWPTMYQGSSQETIEECFRKCCEEVALQNFESNEIGKEIDKLEKQKRAATDLLHGINELYGLTSEVNRILKGAGVAELGA